MTPAATIIQRVLSDAGVTVNGADAGDIKIIDERFYTRVLTQGSLGLGESYMDGWWECPAIDVFISRLLSGPMPGTIAHSWPVILNKIAAFFTNVPRANPYHIGESHYDLGNAFYQAMLGETLCYSCGYWKGADSLKSAQTAKLERICRKLGLQKNQTLLDIGCGWGSLARYASEHHGAAVTGITVSEQQAALARIRCDGLPVKILYQDYHDAQGVLDSLVSVGMFEHVGHKNYTDFFRIAHRRLADAGLFLLHTIGSLVTSTYQDPWITRYIFPHSKLPSLPQITRAIEGLFVVEDIENIGADYDPTLMAWHRNFEAAWPQFSAFYGERFHRMWRYYLLMSAGLFRSRRAQVWQIVLSKRGVPGGYPALRTTL